MHRQNGWPTKICVFCVYWNDSIFSDMEIKINVHISFIIFLVISWDTFVFFFMNLPSAQKYILTRSCLLTSFHLFPSFFIFCALYLISLLLFCLLYNYLSPKLTRKLANFFFVSFCCFFFLFLFLKCWFLLYCNFVQNCRNFLYINCYIYLYYYYYRYFI